MVATPRCASMITPALLFAVFCQLGPAGAQSVCVGDCRNNGKVTVEDIVTMVNIALGKDDVSACSAGDVNQDGQITIDEIITSVSNALKGCPSLQAAATLGPSNATVDLTITLISGGRPTVAIAALGVDFDPGTFTLTGCQSMVASKTLSVSPTNSGASIALYGGTSLLPDGPIIRCQLSINAAAVTGTYDFNLEGATLLDPQLKPVAVTEIGSTIVIVRSTPTPTNTVVPTSTPADICDFAPVGVANELDGTVSTLHLCANQETGQIVLANPSSNAPASAANGSAAAASGAVNAIGGIPRDIAVSKDGRLAYVTTRSPDRVTVLDIGTGAVVATADEAKGTRPEAIALDPTGTRAYVTHYATNEVTVVDTTSNQVIHDATQEVGGGPNGIAITPDNTAVYVTNSVDGTVSLLPINASGAAASAPTTIACSYAGDCDTPSALAITPGGEFVYVANFLSGTVSVISTLTNQITKIINVDVLDMPSLPTGVAITPDGSLAYVTAFGSDAALVIDTATNRVIHAIPNIASFPTRIRIRPADNLAFVTSFALNEDGTAAPGTLSLIDTTLQAQVVAQDGSPVQIPVGRFPVSVALGPPPSTGAPTPTETPVGASPTETPTPEGTPTPTPNCGFVSCAPNEQCAIDVGCHRLGGNCAPTAVGPGTPTPSTGDHCVPLANPFFALGGGGLTVTGMRSSNNTVYFIVRSTVTVMGVQVTSLAISSGLAAMAFNGSATAPDPVLTSFSVALGESGMVPLTRVKRTDIITGISNAQVTSANFSPDANAGTGALYLPDGTCVSLAGQCGEGGFVPRTLTAIANGNQAIPSAAGPISVRRRVGSLTVRGSTIVFPYGQAGFPDCEATADSEQIGYAEIQANTLKGLARGVNNTMPAAHDGGDVVTLVSVAPGQKRPATSDILLLAADISASATTLDVNDASGLPGSGIIKLQHVVSSLGATCSSDNPIPCDPADSSRAVCGGAPCLNFGGEAANQNATLDDSVGSLIGDIPGGTGVCAGTPGCSLSPMQCPPDGFLLLGNCTSDPTCQTVIFVIDTSGACSITPTRACTTNADCGSCVGGPADGSPCVQNSDCAGGGICVNAEKCVGAITGGISFSVSGFKVDPSNIVFGTAGANGAG